MEDHISRNRRMWTKWSDDFAESGRQAWSESAIKWGIWSIPETEIGVLGNLDEWCGKKVVELGCGTAYFSSWFARLGAWPVGIDLTPAQLDNAQSYQRQFGIDFPLIIANGENVPLADATFDLVISEYGASIWCEPHKWVREAARLLRPNGVLIFMRNGTLSVLCLPGSGTVTDHLQRDYFGMHRLEWDDDDSVEFHLPPGEMLSLLRSHGFELEALIELQAPAETEKSPFSYMTPEWARRWPSEEIWRCRKAP